MESSPLFKVVVDQEYVKQLAKEEVKRLIVESGEGTWWDLKRLEVETCRKRDWLIENILLNPRFKDEMKLISNGRESGRWMVRAAPMRMFLDKHFHELNGKQVVGGNRVG
ncbi:DUF771 domain-containing protein [Paenibacillus alvei]|uniref:DUF771 domain-containing protein n=1 Tax=Paenibacillus alvei TaxID=44250 RepID=A0ABT4H740_PAEAL|nr:DUF771 domain-containing protein [Paenibacillus alvei]MCY9764806.1 DUF771 domain-containing protein [Paenibacillus alvei]MCY9770713.1 DUF771 domain-containing protein [Paenibacillus alvei]